MGCLNGFDEEYCGRHRVVVDGIAYYFTTTDKSIMFHSPGEGDIANQEICTTVNTICRLSSKLRGLGATWADVWRQLDAGSMGNARTWSAIVAGVIRDKCCDA